ncbi:Ig-like domain repeat protein [Pseudogemmobacter hezensis]|uniref:Ig-like domain repeat protein n=1 Tax=Pseudogemmobacter hezensis TaxID=2737662 RepID=UPI0020A6642F|nr:Ig-like domain repeat protein [Pseudogemmobacter hezensis]
MANDWPVRDYTVRLSNAPHATGRLSLTVDGTTIDRLVVPGLTGYTFTLPTVPQGYAGDVSVSAAYTDDDNYIAQTATGQITVVTSSAPVATINAPVNAVGSGLDVSLIGSTVSSPVSGQEFTYTWTQTSGTSVTLKNANSQTASFATPVIPPGGTAEALTFSLRVEDNYSRSSSATADILILPQPMGAPTISLSQSSATSVAGQGAQVVVTLSGGYQPTGRISLETATGPVAELPLSLPDTTFTLNLPVGQYSLSARYPGDENNTAATSSIPLNHQVTAPVLSILQQPQSTSVQAGQMATFSVVAENATSYIWFVSTDGLNFTPLTNGVRGHSGVDTATLSVTAEAGFDGYQYAVSVKGGAFSMISTHATLTVTTPTAPSPVLTQSSLRAGPTGGGSIVELTGTGFTAESTVSFGNIAATGVIFVDSTRLVATAPPQAAGQVQITVSNAAVTSTGQAFDYVAPPTLTRVFAHDRLLPGESSQINYTLTASPHIEVEITEPLHGFFPVSVMSAGPGVNQTGANSFTMQGDTTAELSFTIPATRAPGTITSTTTLIAYSIDGVMQPGLAPLSSTIEILPSLTAPTISALTPAAGYITGGYYITITGTDFTPDSSVSIGGKPASAVTFIDATYLVVTIPPGAGGPAAITVTTPGGTSNAQSFTYETEPRVLTFAQPVIYAPIDEPLIVEANLSGAPDVGTLIIITLNGRIYVGSVLNKNGDIRITVPAADLILIGTGRPTTVTATYSGGAGHAGSSASAQVIVFVSPFPVADAGPDQTVAAGASVTLDGSASHAGGSTLTYNWEQTSGTSVSLSAISAAQPSFTAPALNPGDPAEALTFSLIATDSYLVASHADSVTITVEPPERRRPQINILLSASEADWGETVTVTAVLDNTNTPGGNVEFFADGVMLATVPVTGPSTSFTLDPLDVGLHQITAAYSGDAGHFPATSQASGLTIRALTPSLTLDLSSDTSQPGESITLTATLKGENSAGGTISFFNGTDPLATLPIAQGTAALTLDSLGTGKHILTAVYSGDKGHAAANSNPAEHTVTARGTGLVLSLSAPTSLLGESVTLTATVSGSVSATGTITFVSGTNTLGSAPLSGNQAVLTLDTLPIGLSRIVARYDGDAQHPAAVSAPVEHVVNQIATTLTLTATPDTSLSGQNVTLRASVAGIPGHVPAGTVLFSGPDGFSAEVALDASGFAETSSASLTSGEITASYGGNATFLGSTGSVTITVETLEITVAPVLSALPAGEAQIGYTQRLSASGGQAPYAFTVSAGALPPGLTLDRLTGDLSGTPQVPGTHQFTVTVTDHLGNSASARYTLMIDHYRPDPRDLADVISLMDAQISAANGLADDQITRFGARLERLHSEDDRARASLTFGKFALWADSSVSRGDRAQEASFKRGSISIGADYRLSPRFILGAGLGYGLDETSVGDNGSESRSEAEAVVIYGSWAPVERVFIDGLLGHARLDFTSRRHVDFIGDLAIGQRQGSQTFGQLTASYELRSAAWLLAPYGGVRFSRTSLDSYTEASGGPYRLIYGARSAETFAGIIGLRAHYSTPYSSAFATGTLRLGGRAEYRHSFNEVSSYQLGYADLPGQSYSVDGRRNESGSGTVGLNIGFTSDANWDFDLDYRAGFGGGSTSHSIGANLSIHF